MNRLGDYIYIFATIGFTVYGQMILKWRIVQLDPLPAGLLNKIGRLILLIMDPFVFSGFLAAFLASLAWMAAMTKFELSHAYPFMSLNFVFVLILSGYVLEEQVNLYKIMGICLIVLGTVVAARA